MAPHMSDDLTSQESQHKSIKLWTVVVATATVVSGIWGFFFYRTVELKDERIALLESQKEIQGIGEYIKSIDERLARLSLATSVDPIDGRVTFGSGLSGPSAVTKILIEIQDLLKKRKYDLIEEKLKKVDNLYPEFPGAYYFRFLLARKKGQRREAFQYGTTLIQKLPKDKRLLDVYEFLVKYHLKEGNKGKAETLFLSVLRLDPKNEKALASFRKTFGYEPTLSSNSEK